jgi:hypothetical protein
MEDLTDTTPKDAIRRKGLDAVKKILIGAVLCTWLVGCGGSPQPPLATEEVKLPPPGPLATPMPMPPESEWKPYKSADFEVLLPAAAVVLKKKDHEVEVTSRLDNDHLLLVSEEVDPQNSDSFTEESAIQKIAVLEKSGTKVTGHKIMKTLTGRSALDVFALSDKGDEIEAFFVLSGGKIYTLSSLRSKTGAPFEDIKTKFAGSFKITEPAGSPTPTPGSPAASPAAPAGSASKTPPAP